MVGQYFNCSTKNSGSNLPKTSLRRARTTGSITGAFDSEMYQLVFNTVLLPRFGTAAKKLWKQKKNKEREIWKQIVLSPAYKGGDNMPEITARYKSQFRDLFKKKYRDVFDNQPVPLTFKGINQFDARERLDLLAQRYGDAYYSYKKLLSFFRRNAV